MSAQSYALALCFSFSRLNNLACHGVNKDIGLILYRYSKKQVSTVILDDEQLHLLRNNWTADRLLQRIKTIDELSSQTKDGDISSCTKSHNGFVQREDD